MGQIKPISLANMTVTQESQWLLIAFFCPLDCGWWPELPLPPRISVKLCHTLIFEWRSAVCDSVLQNTTMLKDMLKWQFYFICPNCQGQWKSLHKTTWVETAHCLNLNGAAYNAQQRLPLNTFLLVCASMLSPTRRSQWECMMNCWM